MSSEGPLLVYVHHPSYMMRCDISHSLLVKTQAPSGVRVLAQQFSRSPFWPLLTTSLTLQTTPSTPTPCTLEDTQSHCSLRSSMPDCRLIKRSRPKQEDFSSLIPASLRQITPIKHKPPTPQQGPLTPYQALTSGTRAVRSLLYCRRASAVSNSNPCFVESLARVCALAHPRGSQLPGSKGSEGRSGVPPGAADAGSPRRVRGLGLARSSNFSCFAFSYLAEVIATCRNGSIWQPERLCVRAWGLPR